MGRPHTEPVQVDVPIIFLDFDGVLTTENASHHPIRDALVKIAPKGQAGHSYFDPVAIAHLNELCETTGAMVVISSSWRHDDDAPEYLKRAGFTGALHPDWRTNPRLPRPQGIRKVKRGHEIADWLIRHPEVKRYVIIDDDIDMLKEQMTHYVQTDRVHGLSWLDVDDIKERFGLKPLLQPKERAMRFAGQARVARRKARRLTPKD